MKHPLTSKTVNHRDMGDRARDERDFSEAETHYTRHLEEAPGDAPIWVQLGHAVKEQRGHKAAISFYRRAVQEDANDADAYSHLAHSLKTAGDSDGAIDAFQKAYQLQPGNELKRELVMLGMDFPELDRPATTFLMIEDVLIYLRNHATLSGIQRVQAGIILHAVESSMTNVRFVRSDDEDKLSTGSFWEVDASLLKLLLNETTRQSPSHKRMKELIDKCYSDVVPITPRRADTILLLGAFWAFGNTASSFATAKSNGVAIGVYIYDLIPWSHPEYCDAGLVRDFALSLFEISHIVDFFLTISEFTATELRSFLAENEFPDIPVQAVPLAHTLDDRHSVRKKGKWPKSLIELEGAKYVLYVSTIEGRKNHYFLIKVWQQLIRLGVDVPHLVFVGRMGWRIDGLKELLNNTDNLDGRVHIIHDLSDVELSCLYDNAMFTTFTSFVEGWGLPVGESLIHGQPCVASRTSSVPEVGGEFVDYINPLDHAGGVAVFRRMIEDDQYRADRASNIRTNFKARTWKDVSEDIFEKSRNADRGKRSFNAVSIPEAAIVKPGEISDARIDFTRYRKIPTRMLFAPSFYGPEHWGCWMRGKYGSIKFQTDLLEKNIFVYMRMMVSPFIQNARLTIYNGSQKTASYQSADILKNGLVRVSAKTDALGCCSISFKVEGEFSLPSHETRSLAVGLGALGYADADNLGARTEVVEALTFNTSG